uniref:Uncharacterized protein n=1 Tax=Oryza barthii TaxID=65489 RepID=A0A0D3FQQ1_9ORYZ
MKHPRQEEVSLALALSTDCSSTASDSSAAAAGGAARRKRARRRSVVATRFADCDRRARHGVLHRACAVACT